MSKNQRASTLTDRLNKQVRHCARKISRHLIDKALQETPRRLEEPLKPWKARINDAILVKHEREAARGTKEMGDAIWQALREFSRGGKG